MQSNCPAVGVALGFSVLPSAIPWRISVALAICSSASRCRPRRFAAWRLGVALGNLPLGVSVLPSASLLGVSSRCLESVPISVRCTNKRSVYQSAYPGTALPEQPSAATRTNRRALVQKHSYLPMLHYLWYFKQCARTQNPKHF